METNGTVNIVLAGVGGQGIITMATVLADAAIRNGSTGLVAETHGLSQRGGTVIVHVRLGDADAPLIMRGTGDIMMALDAIEALRYLEYLRPGAPVILDKRITPPPLPNLKVPKLGEVLEALRSAGVTLYPVNAVLEAQELGNPRAANIYMLGYALAVHGLGGHVSLEALEEAIRARLRSPETNIRVLHKGYKDGLEAMGRSN